MAHILEGFQQYHSSIHSNDLAPRQYVDRAMWIAAKRQIDADCDISADVDAFVRDIHAQADMLQIGKDREPFLRSVKGQLNLMVRIDAESATKCFTSFTAAFAE